MNLPPSQNSFNPGAKSDKPFATSGRSKNPGGLKLVQTPSFKMRSEQTKSAGEPWVWLTGLGLSIGLLMVVGLLGLILYRGAEVFWPKRLVEWQLKAVEPNVTGEKIVGELVQRRPKAILKAGADQPEELQIFTGNKEVSGQAFRFVDADQMASFEQPSDLIRMERTEYGDAFGVPLALYRNDGSQIAAHDPHFAEQLKKGVAAGVARWGKIREIEKIRIGAINRDLENLEVERKSLEKNLQPGSEGRLAQIESERQTLQKRYEVLAQEAKQLRQAQDLEKLSYQLTDGTERQIPLGQILAYDYPNQLSLTERIGIFFQNIWSFISTDPREANTEGGVFPAIFGTLVMTVLMSLAVVPFGVLAAIYLREYAHQGWFVRMVRIAVNNLAGVPSIVFGVFGLGFFVYVLGSGIDSLFFSSRLPVPTFGTGGILWASLTLALMTVPVVIVSTEEALAAVPRGMREGALACGASKWQAIRSVLLPAAAPGILTGMILAMARGAGEVAPLMLVGVVKLAPTLPINGIFPYIHLDQKFMHLAFNIYDLGFQSPDSEAAQPMVFATTLLLILLVVLLNLGAIFFRERLRKKYASGAF